MNNLPKVSILVTTYNHEHYIANCLSSLVEQETNFPFEIIIGEDGSVDETLRVCEHFRKRYPDLIRILNGDRSKVINVKGKPTGRYNFTQLLNKSKAKYIALCEGDDNWNDKHKIQKQFDALEKDNDLMVSFHDAQLVDVNGKIIYKSWLNHNIPLVTPEQLLSGYPLPTASLMFRNVLQLKNTDYNIIPCADLYLSHLFGQHGGGINQSDSIKPSTYLITGDGIWTSRSPEEKILAELESRLIIINGIDEKGRESVFSGLRRVLKPLCELMRLKGNKKHYYFIVISLKATQKRQWGILKILMGIYFFGYDHNGKKH